MYPNTFLKLCNTLKNNGYLQSSQYVKITDQVAAFCLVMAHGHTQKVVADMLQRSLHTVSVYVNRTATM
jgi:DNA-binding NarL/FixJ family response regulator